MRWIGSTPLGPRGEVARRIPLSKREGRKTRPSYSDNFRRGSRAETVLRRSPPLSCYRFAHPFRAVSPMAKRDAIPFKARISNRSCRAQEKNNFLQEKKIRPIPNEVERIVRKPVFLGGFTPCARDAIRRHKPLPRNRNRGLSRFDP